MQEERVFWRTGGCFLIQHEVHQPLFSRSTLLLIRVCVALKKLLIVCSLTGRVFEHVKERAGGGIDPEDLPVPITGDDALWESL